ncbi:XkdX family protein [Lactobacillus intestinalis]|uniref:XkdX family protein n=1 Tax=Lactobacillus intestinalis TaxID=151781 RepID=UPI0026E9E2A1|nr:XkdX family protein [Lactobacillus intestinalis]
MFDTILASLSEFQKEMIQMYKDQYSWGWFGKDLEESKLTLQGYVQMHAISAEEYKEITGDEYVAGNQTTVANSQA